MGSKISKLHERLGTAGFVVAIVALVAAMAGGAYAAQQGLNGKQKNQVRSIAKEEAKKFANSNPGKDGAPGAAGANGKDGTNGTNGTPGTNGKNVVVGTAGAECAEGGATVEVQGEPSTKKAVCNGEEGEPGEEGDDGEDGACSVAVPKCVLPANATMKGTWGALVAGENIAMISFNLAMNADPTGAEIVAEGGNSANCDDGVAPPASETNPEADPGYVCIFVGYDEGDETLAEATFKPGGALNEQGAEKYGVGVLLSGTGYISGTWAATGN